MKSPFDLPKAVRVEDLIIAIVAKFGVVLLPFLVVLAVIFLHLFGFIPFIAGATLGMAAFLGYLMQTEARSMQKDKQVRLRWVAKDLLE